MGLWAFVPRRDRVSGLGDERAPAEDLEHLAVLDLNHGLRKLNLPVLSKADTAIDAFKVQLRDRVPHVVGFDRAGRLQRVYQGFDGSDRGRHVVIRSVAELSLEAPGELARIAEPPVLQMLRRQPWGHAERIIGILAQRRPEA